MNNNGDGINLKDAKSAFSTFFKQGSVDTETSNSNPAQKILDKLKEDATPPTKRSVTKVDTQDNSKSAIQTMSVDDAENIVDSRKSFKDILKDLKINFSDLFVIIDSFLEVGFYDEKYKIKSLEFTYRTKKVHSIDTINDALDGSKYTLPNAAGQMLLERSMASSLVYFKLGNQVGRVFEHASEEDDALALEFVRKELSSPIYILMVNKLRKFELMNGLATRDEAIEHFLAHTQG
jgi:hypothetical protein